MVVEKEKLKNSMKKDVKKKKAKPRRTSKTKTATSTTTPASITSKKAPSLDNSKQAVKKDTSRGQWEYYKELGTWKEKPVPMHWIEALASDLLEWSLNDENEALYLSDFYRQKKISRNDFMRWLSKSEILKTAYDSAKRDISSRSYKGAVKRKYDANMVKHYLPVYDRDAKEIEEWRAELRSKEEDKNTGNVTIVMDNFGMDKDKDGKKD